MEKEGPNLSPVQPSPPAQPAGTAAQHSNRLGPLPPAHTRPSLTQRAAQQALAQRPAPHTAQASSPPPRSRSSQSPRVAPHGPACQRAPAPPRCPVWPTRQGRPPARRATRPCFPLSAKPVPPVSSTPYLPFFLPAPARTELPSPLSGGPPRLGRPTVQFRLRHLLLEVESRARDHANPLCDPFPPRTGPSETAAAILAVAFHTKAAKILA